MTVYQQEPRTETNKKEDNAAIVAELRLMQQFAQEVSDSADRNIAEIRDLRSRIDDAIQKSRKAVP